MLRGPTNVFKPLSSSSGQGVVEYLLVLIVTVAIILGVIYQFNDAFRVYAKSYFGDYLACLLETGELPSIGGEGNSTCNAFFQEFSIDNGRPLVGNGLNGGGDSSSSSNDSEKSSPSKSSEENGGGSGYVARRNSGSGGGGRFGSGGSSRSGGEFADNSKKSKNNYTGSSDTSIPPTTMGRRGNSTGSNGDYLEGDFYVEKRRAEERTETNKIAAKSSNDTNVKQAERLRVNRQVAAVNTEVEEKEFTIGNFLRIMLILAIIIALIVFLGGQALQISKSMD